MNNKLILLCITLLGTTRYSLCTMLTFTIPDRKSVTFDTAQASDSVLIDTIQELIDAKAAPENPFIMAIVPANHTYHYFDASTIMNLYKNKGEGMQDPSTRAPLNQIYFFQVTSPTDTTATYLCSKNDIFTTDRTRLDRYEPIFEKYLNEKLSAFLGTAPQPSLNGNDNNNFNARPHYDTDPHGRWDGQYWTSSAEIQSLQAQASENRARDEQQRVAGALSSALTDLKTFFNNNSSITNLTRTNNVQSFTLGMLRRLDYVENLVRDTTNTNNNGALLREIAEAKSHIESVQLGRRSLNTNAQRQQFKDRLQKFIEDMTRLYNQIPR